VIGGEARDALGELEHVRLDLLGRHDRAAEAGGSALRTDDRRVADRERRGRRLTPSHNGPDQPPGGPE
jgi:hypothetical protein